MDFRMAPIQIAQIDNPAVPASMRQKIHLCGNAVPITMDKTNEVRFWVSFWEESASVMGQALTPRPAFVP